MSDTTPQGQNGAQPGAGAPMLAVIAQYLKDLSFENPRAPQSFTEQANPNIEVDVNVNARELGQSRYEVEVSVAARARRGADVVFVVETAYAGAFQIENVPRDQMELVMLVECPRILFPFVRQIVADATRNGNYPPLMLEPIDFYAVYQQSQMRRAQQQQAASA